MSETVSDIITVAELAKYMKVNRKTIYDAVSAGRLPGARRLLGTIRIHRPTVLAWLEQGEAPKPRKRSR